MKQIVKNFLPAFLNKNSFRSGIRYALEGTNFACYFNGTIKHLLEKLLFEEGNPKGIAELITRTKQHNVTKHSSLKLRTSNQFQNRMMIIFNKIFQSREGKKDESMN